LQHRIQHKNHWPCCLLVDFSFKTKSS